MFCGLRLLSTAEVLHSNEPLHHKLLREACGAEHWLVTLPDGVALLEVVGGKFI